jgi:hypothetical protein
MVREPASMPPINRPAGNALFAGAHANRCTLIDQHQPKEFQLNTFGWRLLLQHMTFPVQEKRGQATRFPKQQTCYNKLVYSRLWNDTNLKLGSTCCAFVHEARRMCFIVSYEASIRGTHLLPGIAPRNVGGSLYLLDLGHNVLKLRGR